MLIPIMMLLLLLPHLKALSRALSPDLHDHACLMLTTTAPSPPGDTSQLPNTTACRPTHSH